MMGHRVCVHGRTARCGAVGVEAQARQVGLLLPRDLDEVRPGGVAARPHAHLRLVRTRHQLEAVLAAAAAQRQVRHLPVQPGRDEAHRPAGQVGAAAAGGETCALKDVEPGVGARWARPNL